jgi:hypothetical protein
MPLDNENPTVLSASELPTHRNRRRNKASSSKHHAVRNILTATKPSYDPFYMSESESDTDSDDSTVEPIDEQEIYG